MKREQDPETQRMETLKKYRDLPNFWRFTERVQKIRKTTTLKAGVKRK